MRLKVKLTKSKFQALVNSRPPGDCAVALLELVALADSLPPGFYNIAELFALPVELSCFKERLNTLPDDQTIELELPANCYVTPLEKRDVLEDNLALFLGQLQFKTDRKQFSEFMRQNKIGIEEQGIHALLKLLHHSVSRDPDYDDFTRNMLLFLLEDRLPARLMVKLPPGPMPMVPELAIKLVLEEWLTGGGGMESAYARVKEQLGVTRTAAQRVAKKYKLRPATKNE